LEGLLDFGGDTVQSFKGNGTLFTGTDHAVEQLALIKGLAATVLFNDDQRKAFYRFIGSKALVALKALAAAADAGAFIGGTGIDDFAVKRGTIRTFHGSYPLKWMVHVNTIPDIVFIFQLFSGKNETFRIENGKRIR
jgi:hypothetical protein